MNKIDLHLHTTMSDGKYTDLQVINEATKKWLEFISVTEHDIVNTNLPILARENGIQSIEWVEISSLDDKIANKSLHITCYADKFSWEIIEVLEKTRNWKLLKIKKQFDVLEWNWFDVDYDKFIKYFTEKWFDKQNLNNSHISEYIYSDNKNIELVKELTWEDIWWWDFIIRCLKTTWDLRHIWRVKVDKYEPTIDEIWRIAEENWYFLSLAHPNFTFRDDMKLFLDFVEEYKEILNWIEINSLASKIWVEVILVTVKKYNMILTFWSDDHFVRDRLDNKHWFLWELNPHVSEWDIMENFKNFIMLIKSMNKIKKS